MSAEIARPRVVRFGAFEADLASGELRKRGVKLPLQDQPFQLLAALLERPQQILTREEAIQRLWPDGTIVDFEHSLAAAVNKIRSVLGDTAQQPRFLETLPKRGYRFICPVEAEFAGDEREESTASPPQRRNLLPRLAVGLIAAPCGETVRGILPVSANHQGRRSYFSTRAFRGREAAGLCLRPRRQWQA